MTGFKNVKVLVGEGNQVNIEIEKPVITNNQSKLFILFFFFIKNKRFFLIFDELIINIFENILSKELRQEFIQNFL